MKNNLKISILLLVVVFVSSCNDMNDSINKFMKDGERLYMGVPDSVKTFAGKNRFLVLFILNDTRVDTLALYWNQKADSCLIPITSHSLDSVYKVVIGADAFPEGNAVLQFVSKSKGKYKSMTVEKSVNVYGNRYQAKLVSRYFNNAASNKYLKSPEDALVLSFGSATNSSDVGVKVRYFSKIFGAEKDTLISSLSINKALAAAKNINSSALYGYIKIPYVDYDKITKPVTYKTMYLPEPTAIDTFYTKSDTIKTIIIQ